MMTFNGVVDTDTGQLKISKFSEGTGWEITAYGGGWMLTEFGHCGEKGGDEYKTLSQALIAASKMT